MLLKIRCEEDEERVEALEVYAKELTASKRKEQRETLFFFHHYFFLYILINLSN